MTIERIIQRIAKIRPDLPLYSAAPETVQTCLHIQIALHIQTILWNFPRHHPREEILSFLIILD